MQKIPLYRKGKIVAQALVDDVDYGDLSQHTWRLISTGYAYREVRDETGKRLQIGMHRAIVGLEPGDKRQTDHVNRDRLDNRRANLRVVTLAENRQNLPARSGRFRGVAFHAGTGKWRARVTIAGKQHHIGLFDTEDAAGYAAAAFRAKHMPHSIEARVA
jgi:hypothetical protein